MLPGREVGMVFIKGKGIDGLKEEQFQQRLSKILPWKGIKNLKSIENLLFVILLLGRWRSLHITLYGIITWQLERKEKE